MSFGEIFLAFLYLIYLMPINTREIDPLVFGNVLLNHEKDYYNRLLGNLVELNTKRLDSIQKSIALAHSQVRLGDPGARPRVPRVGHHDRDRIPGLIIAVKDEKRSKGKFPPYKLTHETNPEDLSSSESSSETSSETSDEDFPIISDGLTPLQALMLRSSWCKSCSKKASIRCRTACKKAVSSGCSSFNCSSRLKKRIKRNCKIKCRSEFGVNSSEKSS